MKKWCAFLYFAALSISSLEESHWNVHTEAEALALRRIADFWQEGEYQVAKEQISSFLKDYPNSPCSQELFAVLGDLFLREKNYPAALEHYSHIQAPEIAARIFFSRMHCLLELQWFATLADACEQQLKQTSLGDKDRGHITYLLATSLYQQYMNAEHQATSQELAKKALPYFELLQTTDWREHIAPALAHLYTSLDRPKDAVALYTDLLLSNPEKKESLLLQIGLLQARYDKPLAMQTLNEVLSLDGACREEAHYNWLVLAYEQGRYQEILDHKMSLLEKTSPTHSALIRLLLGKSYFQTHNYAEAKNELHQAIVLAEASQSLSAELYHSVLLDLLQISYQLKDVAALDYSLRHLTQYFPSDPQIPRGVLAQVSLLKNQKKFSEARELLASFESRFAGAPECEMALFEQTDLFAQEKNWGSAHASCKEYLLLYPQGNSAPYLWKLLCISSVNHSLVDPTFKTVLVADIELLLNQEQVLTAEEILGWKLVLAQTEYELHHYDKATKQLQTLLEANPNLPNAQWLIALCYRDGNKDFSQFCRHGEKALELKTDLLDPASIHIALFNGYLAQKEEALAANHLYLAAERAAVQSEHLSWLSHYYYRRFTRDYPVGGDDWSSTHLKTAKSTQDAERAYHSLQWALADKDLYTLSEEQIACESEIVLLAEIASYLNEDTLSLTLLTQLKEKQNKHPEWVWKTKAKVDFLLAKHFAKEDLPKAIASCDRVKISSDPLLNTAASLQAARLKKKLYLSQRLPSDSPEWQFLLVELKDLALKKAFNSEPIHLEAAITYIEIQGELSDSTELFNKQLSLYKKMKVDFESGTSLSAQDYQNSRKHFPEKEPLYLAYMRFVEGQILRYESLISKDQHQVIRMQRRLRQLYQELQDQLLPPALEERIDRSLNSLIPIAEE